ncbi:synaptic vesicle glycoprotein 2A-like [Diorhabda carinulata]|uniref:synaptic vesicle glycoprotein 2A-like n=1 Tax=Diorhabda carinulata TaxID=1163345 RepID=UPI0025A06D2E|nr:synaptic vesicle glycoprotein 2A-like [Diorhabda carinulata]
MTAMEKNVAGRKTFEEAIKLTGFGKFNFFIILATGGSLMCVIVETMCAMFITPAAQCDLELSTLHQSLLYSMSFLGVVTGSHLWGYLADTKGRKMVTMLSLIVSSIFSFICSFVTVAWLFILLRFLNGFFIGGSSAIIYAFAGEFHDNRFRPKVVTWIATFVAFGNIYIPGMAWVILPQTWSINLPIIDVVFRPWRLLIIIYALPSLFFVILVFFLPESPKYLMTQGKSEEAICILRQIFAINNGKTRQEYPVKQIIWDDNETAVQRKKDSGILSSVWQQTAPVFRRKYILKTFMVCYLQFAIFFTTSTVIMWYPQILNSMSELGKEVPNNEVTMCKAVENISKNESVQILTDNYLTDIIIQNDAIRSIEGGKCNDNINDEVFMVSLTIGLCYVICYITIGSLINLVGPRRLLALFIISGTVAGICAQLLSSYTFIQVTLGIFLMSAPGIGIVNAIVVDLYPTEIRGMALAVSLMFGRFGAMSGSYAGGNFFYDLCDYVFYIIAAFHILVIIVIKLLPSPKSSMKT